MEQNTVSIVKRNEWKSYPYGIKGIIRHYHYSSDPKLGPGIVYIIIIPYICHACTT